VYTMSSEEDPYETLNIPRDATQSQIKTAYRKLALKYHPDKQTSEDDKRRCGDIFAKIGSAYEILSDQQRRSEYDRFDHVGVNAQQQHGNSHRDPFMSDMFAGGSPFMNDPFFGGGRDQHGREGGGFTDPFDLFRQVFESDFGGGPSGFTDFHNHSQRRPREEDYVEQHVGSRGHGNSFGGGFGMGGFGSGMGSFGMMGEMMNSMRHMPSAMPNQQQGQYYSSSTSSSFQGSGSMSESISTTTRIVNGRRQTVTERTVTKPDGSVETTTETTGNEDFSSLDNGQNRRGLLESNRGSSHRRR